MSRSNAKMTKDIKEELDGSIHLIEVMKSKQESLKKVTESILDTVLFGQTEISNHVTTAVTKLNSLYENVDMVQNGMQALMEVVNHSYKMMQNVSSLGLSLQSDLQMIQVKESGEKKQDVTFLNILLFYFFCSKYQ